MDRAEPVLLTLPEAMCDVMWAVMWSVDAPDVVLDTDVLPPVVTFSVVDAPDVVLAIDDL